MTDDQLRPVVLKGVPSDLYAKASEQNDALQRELLIIRSDDPDGTTVPHRLDVLIQETSARFSRFTQPFQQALLDANEAGGGPVDLRSEFPTSLGIDARRLRVLLDEADEYCRTGGPLLTMASSPDTRAFRHWYLGEFARQLDGDQPRPWPGTGTAEEEATPVVSVLDDDGHGRVLRLHGDIDLVSAGDVRWALQELRDAGCIDIIVDASDVDFLDSVGISVLMVAARRLAGEGGRLVVRDPSPAVADSLRITGLDTVIEVQGPA